MLKVSHLLIYPIKSLAGTSVSAAKVTPKGFENDRRFMLTNPENRFLTLREFPKMTCLLPVFENGGLTVTSIDLPTEALFISFDSIEQQSKEVVIWNATVEAQTVSKGADEWFSDALGASVKLVYMPENSMRPVDTTSGFKPRGKFVSFADAYPFMMMGEASLNDLNERYGGNQKLSIHRFRPNIVFSGGFPNQEDTIEDFTINGIAFKGLENCARCTIPNVNPETGQVDTHTEPLATLAKYRLQDRKINFGRNLVHSGTGTVHIGDILELTQTDKTATKSC